MNDSLSVQALSQHGLINVDYPEPLREAVTNAVRSWKEFCSLPKEEKCAFTFLEDSHGDGAGYELKEDRESSRDLKENFHVTLFQHDRLAKIADKRSFPFLHDAKVLLDQMEPLILQFAADVESEYDVPGLLKEVQESKQYWILRYLHYFGNQPIGTDIAAPHTDKGGFTLHLYESDDGLQHYCINMRRWEPMPVSREQTVIIPGLQLQLRSEGQLKALYHRVVATHETARHGRFSMVCFITFDSTPKYNKKGKGTTHSHELGFNYSLPNEEFATYFHQD